ncbi:MAG: CPBP family intramembrane glutamic endopeptidase [Cyclobacteriaceae bacterium]
MEIYEHRQGSKVHQHWLLSFTVLVLIVFGTLAILQTLALGLIPVLFDIPLDQIQDLLMGELDHPKGRMAFLWIQGLGGGLGFLLGGWLFIRFVDKKTLKWKQQLSCTKFKPILILFPLLMGFVLFNSLFVYLNMNMELPQAFSELEAAMRAKEDQLMQLTQYLTDFENLTEMLLGVLVIAVLAGIGEEYLFRGIIQPKMHRYTGNSHLGIWITAFIFSAIHFQFYGFVPRLLLGALFGYLYLFSGSLVYPMIAHILNNGITVVLVYLNKLNLLEFDLEEPGELYWHYIFIGLIVFVLSMGFFVKEFKAEDGKMA